MSGGADMQTNMPTSWSQTRPSWCWSRFNPPLSDNLDFFAGQGLSPPDWCPLHWLRVQQCWGGRVWSRRCGDGGMIKLFMSVASENTNENSGQGEKVMSWSVVTPSKVTKFISHPWLMAIVQIKSSPVEMVDFLKRKTTRTRTGRPWLRRNRSPFTPRKARPVNAGLARAEGTLVVHYPCWLTIISFQDKNILSPAKARWK